MISRSAILGALVVVELAIIGMAAQALCFSGPFGAAFAGSPAWASTGMTHPRLDRTFATGEQPHVVVDVHDVDVTVEAGSAPRVHVVETIHAAGLVTGRLDRAVAEQTPDGVRITSGAGGGRVVIGVFERSLRLTVPPGARVDIESAGSVLASGLRAKLIAHSDNGAIRVRDHRGDVDLETANGRIELADVQGATIGATSHNGRLVFERIGADRLDATTGNGRVVAHALRVVDGRISSGNGVVELALAPDSDSTVTAHSGNGRVRLHHLAPADTDEDEDHARVVRLGTGRGHFEVSTGNGSITLTQGANV